MQFAEGKNLQSTVNLEKEKNLRVGGQVVYRRVFARDLPPLPTCFL